jgi:hypothetical protein
MAATCNSSATLFRAFKFSLAIDLLELFLDNLIQNQYLNINININKI